MDCEDCTESTHQPWNCYSSGCAGCEKRMLACMVGIIAASQIKDEPQENTDGRRTR